MTQTTYDYPVPAIDRLNDNHATAGQIVMVTGFEVIDVDGETVLVYTIDVAADSLHSNSRLETELEFIPQPNR